MFNLEESLSLPKYMILHEEDEREIGNERVVEGC